MFFYSRVDDPLVLAGLANGKVALYPISEILQVGGLSQVLSCCDVEPALRHDWIFLFHTLLSSYELFMSQRRNRVSFSNLCCDGWDEFC